MIRIENVVLPSAGQWEAVIRGMRNPKNSWEKSDSKQEAGACQMEIGPNDHKLMMSLAKGGAVHAKYRRMVPVYADITCNHTWWAEFDTYKVGTVRNSCSKMHKIHVKEFRPEDFSHEGIDEVGGIAAEQFQNTLNVLEWLRRQFNETQEKKYWRAIIELLPMGFNLKATVFLNYEVLHNIYHSRKGHKMFEWRDFCAWIETLPYSELITVETKAREGQDMLA